MQQQGYACWPSSTSITSALIGFIAKCLFHTIDAWTNRSICDGLSGVNKSMSGQMYMNFAKVCEDSLVLRYDTLRTFTWHIRSATNQRSCFGGRVRAADVARYC